MLEFLVVVTGYNCQQHAIKSYQSVLSQTYQNFKCVIVDDASTDKTPKLLKQYIYPDGKFDLILSTENMGAAYWRYHVIKNYCYSEHTIVLLLGLDDYLMPNALERIKKEYDNGAWMTYGNWVSQDGYKLKNDFLYFDKQTHEARNYRNVIYRSTAPNTFKRFLFDELTEEDFKYNGQWVKATTESNLMFSCLEMCGEKHIGVITDHIYLYNKGRHDSALKRHGEAYQNQIFNYVKQLPKKPLLKNESINLLQ